MSGIRVALVFLVLVSVATVPVTPETISVDGVGAGDVWAAFSEFGLTATLAGDVCWTGDVEMDQGVLSFAAEGTFRGIGVHDLLDSVTEGWLAYDASGRTTEGIPVVLRGLLVLVRSGGRPVRAGETVGGSHYAVLAIAGRPTFYVGGFLGSAQAELVPSEEAWTLQLQGAGSVRLTGEDVALTDSLLSTIPLDHPALTMEFVAYVEALFASYLR